MGSRLRYGTIALLSAIVIPLAGGVALTGYFVKPSTVWHQIASWQFTFGVKAGIIGVAIYMLITSIFVRHVLCRYVCAAGLMQMLFGWISPVSLRLKMDTARIAACTDCKGCDRACFMNVTPRKNKRDISCVNCGACVVACNKELGTGQGVLCSHLLSEIETVCDDVVILNAGQIVARGTVAEVIGRVQRNIILPNALRVQVLSSSVRKLSRY